MAEIHCRYYCEVCRNIVKDKRRNDSFVVGTQVMKLEAIKSHETSNCHKDCMAIKASRSSSVQTSETVKQLSKLTDSTNKKMQVLVLLI